VLLTSAPAQILSCGLIFYLSLIISLLFLTTRKDSGGSRVGLPLDVANACVFFGSNLSTYVTGQVLNVCGGMQT